MDAAQLGGEFLFSFPGGAEWAALPYRPTVAARNRLGPSLFPLAAIGHSSRNKKPVPTRSSIPFRPLRVRPALSGRPVGRTSPPTPLPGKGV